MASLADPTRLRLLRLLERHELGVAELCDVLQLPQSTVSRHLKVLADQGWLAGRAQGTNRSTGWPSSRDPALAGSGCWPASRPSGWPTVEQDRLRLTRRLSEREPAAQAFFAGAAGRWDKLRSELYGEAFSREALLALLPADWVVADLGCGTGQTAMALAPHVRRVIGVDQSGAMLKAAKKRSRRPCATSSCDRGVSRRCPLEDASVRRSAACCSL